MNSRLIGGLCFLVLCAAVTGSSQEQPNVSLRIDSLISRGFDPRVSRKIPLNGGAPRLTPPVYREVPSPTSARTVRLQNGRAVINPNIRLHPNPTTTQSEMSIAAHPLNPDILMAGSNAVLLSTAVGSQGWYLTTDRGASWQGGDTLPTHHNFSSFMSDPSTAVDLDGNLFLGTLLIGSSADMVVARSTDNGAHWSQSSVPDPTSGEDKDHLVVDVNPGGAFEGRLYAGYTDFALNPSPVKVTISTDHGQTFASPAPISDSVGSAFAQGVNLAVGPDGQVCATWSGYDNFPATTTRLGFNVSTNGGSTWRGAHTVTGVNDIRGTLYKGPNSIRVSSFPSMAVDRSSGSRRGWIYIVYAAKSGLAPDIFLVRSTDGGTSWSSPAKVNQDNSHKDHWFPWAAVDPSTGILYVAYYDSRNFSANDSAQVYCSSSFDGGDSFDDVLVSDVPFLPAPIPGLAGGYMGDYIGVVASHGTVWPCWNDNRTGIHQAYTSRLDFVQEVGGPPIIAASPDTLDFHGVYLAHAETLSVTIRNLAFPETLVVGDIHSDSSMFTPELSSLTVPGAGARNVRVAFHPVSAGLQRAHLVISSNDTAHPAVSLVLQGVGKYPPAVGVSPDSLAFTVEEGDSASSIMTISNSGLGDMQFSLVNRYILGPGALQKPAHPRFTAGVSGGIDSSVRVLLYDGGSFGAHLILDSLRIRYTLVGAAQLDTIHFEDFDLLYVPTLGSDAQIQPLINRAAGIKSFVESGHAVVALFEGGTNSWQWLPLAVTQVAGGCFDAVHIVDTTHPAMDSLTDAGLSGWSCTYHGTFTSYDPSLVPLALGVDAGSKPMILAGSDNSGRIYITDADNDSHTYRPETFTMVKMALRWASGATAWVSEAPAAGTVLPGGNANIGVKVRSDALDGGTFHSEITISTNDPIRPTVRVPVQLTVVGAPNLVVARDTVNFSDVFINYADTLPVRVTNNGSDTLRVSGMSINNPDFTLIDPGPFNIGPNRNRDIRVRFVPPAAGPDAGSLALTSNDPGDPTVTVALAGNGVNPPVVGASPDSLGFTLNAGDSLLSTLTVENTGLGTLTFGLSNEYVSPGPLLLKSALPDRVPSGTRRLITIAASSPRDGNRPAPGAGPRTMQVSVIDSSMRIVTIDLGLPENTQALDLLGFAYVKLSPAAFDSVDLSAFDLLYVGWTSGASSAAMQSLYNRRNDIGSFVRNGGGLVALSNPGGTPFAWQWIPVAVSGSGNAGDLVHILDTTHALMDSSSDASLSHWSNSYHATLTSFDPALQVLAVATEFSNQALTLAGQVGSGRIALTGQDPDWHYVNQAQPGAGILLRHMLRWAGGTHNSWLSEFPNTGTVGAGGGSPVQVKVNTGSLDAGRFNARIKITSNDPARSILRVPVGLTVIGAPNLSLPNDTLDFGGVFVGYPDTMSLHIGNSGTDTLRVSGMNVTNAQFRLVDSAHFNLAPRASRDVRLRFLPTGPGSETGGMSIASNDPGDSITAVTLLGTGISPPIAGVSPDSLGFTLNKGDSSGAPLKIRNTGLGTLRFKMTPEFTVPPPLHPVTIRTSNSPVRPRASDPYRASPAVQAHKLPAGFGTKSTMGTHAIEPDAGRLFGAGGGRISEINPTTGAIIRSFPTPVATSDGPTALASSETALYFTDAFETSSIYVLDPGTGAVLTSYPAPSGSIDGLAFVNGHLYAQDYSISRIYELDPASGAVTRVLIPPVPVGGGLDGGNGRLFASTFTPSISELSLADASVIRTFTPVHQVYGLGFTGAHLFASVPGGGIDEYNPNTGAYLGSISTSGFAALAGASSGWLTAVPDSGTVGPVDSFTVQINVKTALLNGGTYYADVRMDDNDPARRQITTPVRLRVIGIPKIALGSDTLNFGNTYVGYPDTLSIRISSNGSDTLHVRGMHSSDPDFALVDPDTFSLPEFQQRDVRVRFLPSGAGTHDATLRVASDDPDDSAAVVRLLGNGVAPPAIAVNPDSIVRTVDAGDSIAVIVKIRNSGLGSLAFGLQVAGGGGVTLLSNQFALAFRVASFNGSSETIQYGIHPGATYGIDEALGEFELPPPSPSLDIRFVDIPGRPRAMGLGLALDLRGYSTPTQIDTYQVKIQSLDNIYPITAEWSSGLSTFVSGLRLLNPKAGGTPLNVDMLTTTGVAINDPDVDSLLIVTGGGPPGWISASPVSGTVAPLDSQSVLVRIRTDQAQSQTLEAAIVINSNDPLHPHVPVPVRITVRQPAIAVVPDSLFVTVRQGDSAVSSVRVSNAGAGVLHCGIAPVARGSDFGDTTLRVGTSGRLRGNIYAVDYPSVLAGFGPFLNITVPTEVQHLVYESNAQGGPYHILYRQTVANSGTGKKFYASAPANLTLLPGKFYFIGEASVGTVSFYETSRPLPLSTPFGRLVSSGQILGYPPPDSLTPSPTAPGVWYQTVSIIPSLLAVDPDTATLAPGSGSDVAISLKAGLAPGVYRFNLAFRSNDAVRPELLVPLQVTVLLSNLGVEAGWNLISVPVRVGNYRAGALFPGAVSHAYSYSGGYTKEDTLRPGAGYWLKFADPQVFDMPGENVPAETVRVAARWNLVGSVTSPVAGNRITSDPPSIMTTGFIGYRAADGYTYADTLKPGSAYWVRVSGGGQLILQGGGYPPGQAPSATKPNIRFPLVTAERATKEELSTLVFTDPKGRKRTLYFGSDQQQSEKELVELPPAPGEAFDVRFRSQRGVELANPLEPGSQEFPIQIQGAELPLSISWEVLPKIGAAVLQITSSDGGTKEYSLKGSGTALLAGGPYKSAKLVINAAGSARIPTSFALRQNFPNPFNPSTEIGFDLPENSDVKIVIYDVLGSEVKTLVDGRWDAGEYRALWTGQADDGRQVASGIYFLRMSAQSSKSDRHFVSTRKMLLAK